MRSPLFYRQTRRLRLVMLSLICVFLFGCGDQSKLEQAFRDVEAREAKALEREAATLKLEKDLMGREKLLADGIAKLAVQKKETEAFHAELVALQTKLQEEMAKLEKAQKALALRLHRGSAPNVTAQRVLVVDPENGEILFEKNADLKGPVASTQKLLTALIIVESGNLDQMVTIQKSDTTAAPTKFGFQVGEQYSRRQLVTSLLVRSFNDVAEALARDNAGSVEAFVVKMNQKAAALGMKNSRFCNPHGLPHDDQYSTARDMAIVAKAALASPEICQMITQKTFDFVKNDGSIVTLTNTNRVLRNFPYCTGMKTGYTNAAGYCLVSSGKKDDRVRIVLMFNGTSGRIWSENQALLDWSLKG